MAQQKLTSSPHRKHTAGYYDEEKLNQPLSPSYSARNDGRSQSSQTYGYNSQISTHRKETSGNYSAGYDHTSDYAANHFGDERKQTRGNAPVSHHASSHHGPSRKETRGNTPPLPNNAPRRKTRGNTAHPPHNAPSRKETRGNRPNPLNNAPRKETRGYSAHPPNNIPSRKETRGTQACPPRNQPPPDPRHDPFYSRVPAGKKIPDILFNQDIGGYYGAVGMVNSSDYRFFLDMIASTEILIVRSCLQIHHWRNNTIESAGAVDPAEIKRIFAEAPDTLKIPISELYKRMVLGKLPKHVSRKDLNFWKLPVAEEERFKRWLDRHNGYNGYRLFRFGKENDATIIQLIRNDLTTKIAQYLNSVNDVIESLRDICYVEPIMAKNKGYWMHFNSRDHFYPSYHLFLFYKRLYIFYRYANSHNNDPGQKAIQAMQIGDGQSQNARSLARQHRQQQAELAARQHREEQALHRAESQAQRRNQARGTAPPSSVRNRSILAYQPEVKFPPKTFAEIDNLFLYLLLRGYMNKHPAYFTIEKLQSRYALQLFAADSLLRWLHGNIDAVAEIWQPQFILTKLVEIFGDQSITKYTAHQYTFGLIYQYITNNVVKKETIWHSVDEAEYWRKVFDLIKSVFLYRWLGSMIVWRADRLKHNKRDYECDDCRDIPDYHAVEFPEMKRACNMLHDYDLKNGFEKRSAVKDDPHEHQVQELDYSSTEDEDEVNVHEEETKMDAGNESDGPHGGNTGCSTAGDQIDVNDDNVKRKADATAYVGDASSEGPFDGVQSEGPKDINGNTVRRETVGKNNPRGGGSSGIMTGQTDINGNNVQKGTATHDNHNGGRSFGGNNNRSKTAGQANQHGNKTFGCNNNKKNDSRTECSDMQWESV